MPDEAHIESIRRKFEDLAAAERAERNAQLAELQRQDALGLRAPDEPDRPRVHRKESPRCP